MEKEGGFDSDRLKEFQDSKGDAVGLPIQIVEKLASLGIHPGDVEERFVRGTGPGGQKINKTSSTVWLRHRPTGVEVRCQRERSQSANRELAWSELAEKLAARTRAAAATATHVREAARRRVRQKHRGQKVQMIVAKHHRAKHKAGRGRVDWSD
jgi:peptide chain release factor